MTASTERTREYNLLKADIASYKRELQLENQEHRRTVAMITKDIKVTEKLILKIKKGK